jgi:hypothetical protein
MAASAVRSDVDTMDSDRPRPKPNEATSAKQRYIVGATLVFSVSEVIITLPMIWPSGLHTARDLVGFLFLLLIAGGGGVLFSAVTWKVISKWFRR